MILNMDETPFYFDANVNKNVDVSAKSQLTLLIAVTKKFL